MFFRLISTDPANGEQWKKVRDGLGLLRIAAMGSIAFLFLLGGAAAYFALQGGIPGMPDEFPGDPTEPGILVPLIIGGVVLVAMIVLAIMQMIGFSKCTAAPEGSAAKGWIRACTTLSAISMLAALAAGFLPFIPGLADSGMPPAMVAMIIAGLQLGGNLASMLSSLMFVFFLRAIGQQFKDDGVVTTINQMLAMVGMLVLGTIAVGVLVAMSGGTMNPGAPGMMELAVIGGIVLLLIGSYVWYLRALGGARDAVDRALQPAAARFLDKIRYMV